jgi:hypothetical protein
LSPHLLATHLLVGQEREDVFLHPITTHHAIVFNLEVKFLAGFLV